MALKILLADDSMTAQNMGKKILTDAGYEVVAVSNGAAAVKKIAEISPHLCILDIYMPGYTGLEVCEKVKGSSVTARMPVLLTVGKMEPYKPEEGARVRADGVIVKPFEASELLRAVQRFSQRIGLQQGRVPTVTAPPPAPVATQATYERTVKLTREQMQEIMDPSLARWSSNTPSAEVVASSPSRIEVPVEVATVPAINVEDVVATTSVASTADAMPTFVVPAVLPEDDVLISELENTKTGTPKNGTPASSEKAVVEEDEPFFASAEALPPATEEHARATVPSVEIEVAASATSETQAEPVVIHSVEGVHSTGVEILTDELQPEHAEQNIPAVDPSLEMAPAVNVDTPPDPKFESTQDVPAVNATEEGLQPTSRAAESAGVVTSTDPYLSPMEGLIDAVQPLEGGRYEPPVKTSVEEAAENEKPVTEEIAAVLSLLGQTIATEVSTVALDVSGESGAQSEEGAFTAPAGRVWMAEEVGLTDSETSMSLENEMRVAEASAAAQGQPVLQTATALAEEPVREDKNAPISGAPQAGGSPPDAAASSTEQLAAAMAAAFGGALPKEELARAEETQSISEEVRRFALGDVYKAKPTFSGAAVEDAEDKAIPPSRLAAAIGRALDRIKPQLIAEIMKELASDKEN